MEKQNPWLLSKTSYIKGRQCVKALWLHRFLREVEDLPTLEEEMISAKGRGFESHFRKMFIGNGIDVSIECNQCITDMIEYTTKALNESTECTLYEAAICRDEVVVVVDVLRKEKDGEIYIYEIKSSTYVKSIHLWDSGLQYYVCKQAFGDQLKGFYLAMRSKQRRVQILEVSDQIIKRQQRIEEEVSAFKEIVLREQSPEIPMGKHCNIPYTCKYKTYCQNS